MKGPLIGVRTHGGPTVGLGHVRRCLALASALQRLHASVLFIVSDDANTLSLIERHSFEHVSTDASHREPDATLQIVRERNVAALITDSYDIDRPYLAAVQPYVKPLVVLDDMADRSLPADMVVNAAIGAETLPYADLTHARLLLGSRYCLLREEFAHEPDRSIRPDVRRVLITIGGSDPSNLTSCLMHWVRQVLPCTQLDVVVGPFFNQPLEVADIQAMLHHGPHNMRDLMLACDLAICSGGQTSLELAATGTPAVAIQAAENQTHNLMGLSRAGVLRLAGRSDDVDLENRVKVELETLAHDAPRRAALSARGRALIDGCGADRVAQAIMAEQGR